MFNLRRGSVPIARPKRHLRQWAAASAAVAVGAGLLAVVGTSGASGAPGPVDHFLCYAAKQAPNTAAAPQFPQKPNVVELINQFAPHGFFALVGPAANQHCNPVDKKITIATTGQVIDTPITKPADHLACWKVKAANAVPATAVASYTVIVSNQFGTARLTTGALQSLCLPSFKSLTDPGNPTPVGPDDLDHYSCYAVRYDPTTTSRFVAPGTVRLTDQFNPAAPHTVRIGVPQSLCLPTIKIVDPAVPPAGNTDINGIHLLCMTFAPAVKFAPPLNVWDTNQFGTGRLAIPTSKTLCLPSTKRIVIPGT
jgi:hypothetical protein